MNETKGLVIDSNGKTVTSAMPRPAETRYMLPVNVSGE